MHTFYNHNEVLGELRINQEKNDFKEQYDPVVVTVNLYHLANKVYELVLENKDAHYGKGISNYKLEAYAIDQAMCNVLGEFPIGNNPPVITEIAPILINYLLKPCLINDVVTTIEFLLHDELEVMFKPYSKSSVEKAFSYYVSPYVYVLVLGIPKKENDERTKS